MALTRDQLWALLGWPEGPPPLRGVDVVGETAAESFRQQQLRFDFVTGFSQGHLLLPPGSGPHPGVLYCHAHGNNYTIGADELLIGRPALQRPFGPDLVERGIAVLAIDLAPFGGRQSQGPEAALAKVALWRGRPLMGQMLAELHAAFRWLSDRPEVDAARIATLGLSMGATHAYWLAALALDIAAAAHLCAFSQIGPLIDTGAHDLHGPYMTVPGLLAHGDMADVAALIAPRPQLICSGGKDPLTPPQALTPALARLRAAYGASEALTILTEPKAGHEETPEMRAQVFEFLSHNLRPDQG